MFGWGRKKDGFEWHKHVRTTIKLRREDRRARFQDVRDVAGDGLKYAGRVGVSAGTSGAVSAWNGLISVIQAVIKGVHAAAQWSAGWLAATFVPAASHAASATGQWARAALRAAGRAIEAAGDQSVRALPALGRLSGGQRRAVAITAVGSVLLVGGYLAARSGGQALTSLASFSPFAPQLIEGRATAIDGDTIRLSGSGGVIRLSGIEAPAPGQKCTGANKKRWSCGEAAQAALQRIVRSRTVRCEVSGADESGRSLGTCRLLDAAAEQDIAAQLVKEGAVFAESSLFGGYGAFEADAQAKKIGLWKGEAERPADYRVKVWEEAAKAAPDGCPIKGQVAGEVKTYLLPWQPDYGGTRVRAARGERWFCSESEAQAAGWTVATR